MSIKLILNSTHLLFSRADINKYHYSLKNYNMKETFVTISKIRVLSSNDHLQLFTDIGFMLTETQLECCQSSGVNVH